MRPRPRNLPALEGSIYLQPAAEGRDAPERTPFGWLFWRQRRLIMLCFFPQPNASDLIPCCPHPFPRQLKQPVTQFGAVRLCCHFSPIPSEVFKILGS